MEIYWTLLGIGPWRIYTYAPPALRETMVRGKPVEYSMQLALAQAGPVQLELIQPVPGRLPEWDNVYIATRFGTLGMMMSPGTSRVMADLIIAGGRAPARFKNMIEVLSPAGLW